MVEAYKTYTIPTMEVFSKKESEGSVYDVVFHEQEYGARCHNDRKYNKWKDAEFAKINWMRRKQSPHSPLFYVNNHFYFHRHSKEILVIQSLIYGTWVLKNEKILSVVDKIWNDKYNAVIISRGWM